MRKILGVMLLLLICILPCFATAELVLELGDERIVVGEWLQTFIRGRQDETLAYGAMKYFLRARPSLRKKAGISRTKRDSTFCA